ncbi:MAG: hypothetical protein CEO12_505 [Parcubacteria group bacterium Gr01-1014_46]|nr:MAG: hypothetical protein CEO12_505 [Parcubacteria group bacterium Gr01-1014_46]
MKNDNALGIVILLSLIAIAVFGGSKGTSNGGFFKITPQNQTPEQKQVDIQYQITQAQYKADELKKQIQAEEDKKTQSVYKDIIDLSYVTRSEDPKQEYLTIRVNTTKAPINITGWIIKSLASGVSVSIPKGTPLFFTGTVNSEEDIYLDSGDTMYLITGISPNGSSFKLNKCSGYLAQFQTFTPYLYTSCPQPKNENLSSIPRTVNNDACFDYIDYFPTCRIQTESLPANWSYECVNFIYSKINYPSCVNTHKNDKDFYLKEWRVYLKRSEKLWKSSREEIVLYDDVGKIVDTLKY